MKRHPFNLVEILLALGVIMIGVVSLSGLFPIASKVSSDANMETYVANALEEFSAYIRAKATMDDETAWNDWMNSATAKIPSTIPSAMLKADEDEHVAELTDMSKWEAVGEINPLLFKYTEADGVYQLLCIHGKMALTGSGILDMSKLDDEFFIDSRVIITVWRSKIKRTLASGASEQEYDFKYGGCVNIKAGWPAERPEATHDGTIWTPLRQIKVQAFDLLNPYPVTGTP